MAKSSASAAEIADNAVRPVKARHNPERRQFRFPRARQDFDSDAADALGLGDEIGTVAGVAARGGGDRVDAADLHYPAERAKAPQRRQGLGDGVRRQQPRGLNLSTEPAQGLFVE